MERVNVEMNLLFWYSLSKIINLLSNNLNNVIKYI